MRNGETRLAIDFQIRRRFTTLIDIRKQLNFPRILLFYLTVRPYPLPSIPLVMPQVPLSFRESRKNVSHPLRGRSRLSLGPHPLST